jgi:hypothetical protein
LICTGLITVKPLTFKTWQHQSNIQMSDYNALRISTPGHERQVLAGVGDLLQTSIHQISIRLTTASVEAVEAVDAFLLPLGFVSIPGQEKEVMYRRIPFSMPNLYHLLTLGYRRFRLSRDHVSQFKPIDDFLACLNDPSFFSHCVEARYVLWAL